MTYTFRLSRRLAQFWHATLVATTFFSLSCTSTDGGSLEPPPIEDWIVLSPDSTSVGVSQTVQFEAVDNPPGGMALSRTRRSSKVVSLALSPKAANLSLNASQPFSVAVKLSGGSTMTTSALSWSATGAR